MRALPIVWLVFAGCSGSLGGWSHATAEQLTRRASFDLGCGEKDLRYTRIDDQTQGVSGCAKHATYVETCAKHGDGDAECTWLLNGLIESNAGGPGQPPPGGTAATGASK